MFPYFFSTRNALDDLLFTIRYAPKAAAKTIAYALCGATLGYGISYTCTESLKHFAEDHHDEVDLTDSYVRDDEQFLHVSRDQRFNQVTPPISDFIPYYAAIVGAGAGTLFAVSKVTCEFKEQLEEDRARRTLDLV
ncbi:hypothetical protein [Legionella fallonii]|uniref:Uncharacterized protein n=1 Tax=Legionella fallonii LLAP-10 TaxID=1212491 RepID=A0A098G0Y2_9GAMM|nr:hypothetical protein [Legionella fallonii]CEG55639.1 conserved protein of unknown function [Legionella fallonii LLAP-10]